MLKILSESTEMVRLRVEASTEAGWHDPSWHGAYMAFTATLEDPVLWFPAVWEQDGRTKHYACVLVGPEGVVVPEGTWHIWIKVITGDTEWAALVGRLRII